MNELWTKITRLTRSPFFLDATCLALLAAVLYPRLGAPHFTNDAWLYYDLASHLFDDFYRSHIIRQCEIATQYSTAFPPLYPLVLACVRTFCDLGIFTGFLVNAVIAALTLWPLKRVARALHLPSAIGNVLFVLLLANSDYVDEVAGARSIPLAILLSMFMLWALIRGDFSRRWHVFVFGALQGLICLTRFDFLLASLLAGGLVAWFAPRRRLAMAAIYYLAFLLALSPWIIYSEARFSKPLVSDNARVAWMADPGVVAEFFPPGDAPRMIWNAPARWACTLATHKSVVVGRTLLQVCFTYFPLFLLLGAAACVRLMPVRPLDDALQEHNSTGRRLRCAWWLVLGQMVPVLVTGFTDRRYFAFLLLLSTISLVHYICMRGPASLTIALADGRGVAIAAACTVLFYLQLGGFLHDLKFPPAVNRQLNDVSQFNELVSAIKATSDTEPVLLIVSDSIGPSQFSVLTGIVTVRKPVNLTAKTLPALVKMFKITHVFDDQHEFFGAGQNPLPAAAQSLPGLFRIDAPTTP